MSYEPLYERNKQLQQEYLDRIARNRPMRIPPSVPEYGPDWRESAHEMIERVRLLKKMLAVALMKEREAQS